MTAKNATKPAAKSSTPAKEKKMTTATAAPKKTEKKAPTGGLRRRLSGESKPIALDELAEANKAIAEAEAQDAAAYQAEAKDEAEMQAELAADPTKATAPVLAAAEPQAPAAVETTPVTAPVVSEKAKKAPKAKREPKPKVERKGESTAQNPVALVHSICAEMTAANPQVARKDILAACMSKGVAFYTAATQVQRWRSAQKKPAAK